MIDHLRLSRGSSISSKLPATEMVVVVSILVVVVVWGVLVVLVVEVCGAPGAS